MAKAPKTYKKRKPPRKSAKQVRQELRAEEKAWVAQSSAVTVRKATIKREWDPIKRRYVLRELVSA